MKILFLFNHISSIVDRGIILYKVMLDVTQDYTIIDYS